MGWAPFDILTGLIILCAILWIRQWISECTWLPLRRPFACTIDWWNCRAIWNPQQVVLTSCTRYWPCWNLSTPDATRSQFRGLHHRAFQTLLVLSILMYASSNNGVTWGEGLYQYHGWYESCLQHSKNTWNRAQIDFRVVPTTQQSKPDSETELQKSYQQSSQTRIHLV